MDKNDAGGLSLPHIKGPSCARPMPLQLPSDGEIVGSPGSVGVPSASGKQRLERSESHDVDRCLVH